MPTVYSTMSAGVKYCIHAERGDKSLRVVDTIEIKGGANVAKERTLVTPKGVATKVKDEELAILMKNHVFLQQLKDGHILVDETSDKATPNARAKDMESRDKSSPKTPKDFEKHHLGLKPTER